MVKWYRCQGRVLIQSLIPPVNGTVGVFENIIEASQQALVDLINYPLMKRKLSQPKTTKYQP